MIDLSVSGNRMYRPVALLATGFFMELKTEIKICLDFSPAELEEYN